MPRDIILELLKLTIMLVSLLLTTYVIPWVKSKTQNEKMHSLIDLATQAVLAAEQVHQSSTGAERKLIVTKFIKELLIQKNISISDEEIDMLIEAAVKQMNMHYGK